MPEICHPNEDPHNKAVDLLKLAVGADPFCGQTWYFLGRYVEGGRGRGRGRGREEGGRVGGRVGGREAIMSSREGRERVEGSGCEHVREGSNDHTHFISHLPGAMQHRVGHTKHSWPTSKQSTSPQRTRRISGVQLGEGRGRERGERGERERGRQQVHRGPGGYLVFNWVREGEGGEGMGNGERGRGERPSTSPQRTRQISGVRLGELPSTAQSHSSV